MKTNFFAILLMVSSFASAQVFDDFDTDMNGHIDRGEFDEGYAANYSQWDADYDGSIDDTEFYSTTYERIDENMDGNLSQDEWRTGQENLFGDQLGSVNYGQLDVDGDGQVTNDEFYEGMVDSNFYSSYDANMDGSIDQDEMNESIFLIWDANRDGILDRNEYDTYSVYYLEM